MASVWSGFLSKFFVFLYLQKALMNTSWAVIENSYNVSGTNK